MIEVEAPAKLTVSLRVTAVRDDGYHEIDAEMVTLDFGDVLRIDPDGDGLEITGPYGVAADEDNLVRRALRLADQDGRRKAAPGDDARRATPYFARS